MIITTLIKYSDHINLAICGHLTKQEIKSLKEEGWRRENNIIVNKNGIPVK